jgi:thioredoxin 1
VDENQELAAKFGIRSIPTLLLFKGGQVKEQIVGMTGKKDLERKLAVHLG